MPKVSKARNPHFETLSVEAKSFNERNDCTVKALAVGARISYAEAHEALRKKGRRNGKGFYSHAIVSELTARGFKVSHVEPSDVVDSYPAGHRGYVAPTMSHFDKYRKVYGNKRLLVRVRGHVAFYDGENGLVDWSVGRSLRITDFWVVEDA